MIARGSTHQNRLQWVAIRRNVFQLLESVLGGCNERPLLGSVLDVGNGNLIVPTLTQTFIRSQHIFADPNGCKYFCTFADVEDRQQSRACPLRALARDNITKFEGRGFAADPQAL